MSTTRPHDPYESPTDTGTDTDVAVVGNGPVGAALSVLLAQRGLRVTVLERRPRPYLLPRATSFDGETARLLAATGVGDRFGEITEPATGYQWHTAAGETLLDIAFSPTGRYGWPDANTMHQPALERLLAARAAALPGVTVLRGHRVVDLAERDDRVSLTVETDDGAARTVDARWVVGCDGANSFVREHLGVPMTDLGFSYEWLLCDVELREPRAFTPTNVQICDPARPTTLVGSGPGHRRWEFMRLPGESSAELNRPETAWRLLKPFGVTPETATLLRSTTYIFRAAWADEWRSGRVLLAGDAAHLMPPFAGQGMCSGLRDAANLAWKLDLTLRGLADASLLDTYAEERRQHVKESILSSVQLGRVICVTDPAAAAERDATVLAGPARSYGAGGAGCGEAAVGRTAAGVLGRAAGTGRRGGAAVAGEHGGRHGPVRRGRGGRLRAAHHGRSAPGARGGPVVLPGGPRHACGAPVPARHGPAARGHRAGPDGRHRHGRLLPGVLGRARRERTPGPPGLPRLRCRARHRGHRRARRRPARPVGGGRAGGGPHRGT
ncbi:bifunctional 3-(3-hydroxy-phenyl)propionate/3-hydroxycinnamic acid hydroxylase [Streptomyces werraensis]|nr:bifunctional 3-(3-hydroxy-phenyl)propionate/3-hydroxycinnamic acid hydroxylase [Streptomyces werraensis]